MKLTIELNLIGGEPIPSSEIGYEGRNEAHTPRTPDTRSATLRHALEAAVNYVERKAAELSVTHIKDPASPVNEPEKEFGQVTMKYEITE